MREAEKETQGERGGERDPSIRWNARDNRRLFKARQSPVPRVAVRHHGQCVAVNSRKALWEN